MSLLNYWPYGLVAVVIILVVVPPAVIVPKRKAHQSQSQPVTAAANSNPPTVTATSSAAPTSTITPQNCGTTLDWAANATAYNKADTDKQLASWWQQQSTAGQVDGFDELLLKSFGARRTGARCGLRYTSNCQASGCADFLNNRDPTWAYEAQVSLVNIHEYFDGIITGTGRGQQGFTNAMLAIALAYFPRKDSEFPVSAVLSAIGFLLAILVAAIGFPEAIPLVAGLEVSTAALSFASSLLSIVPPSIDTAQLASVEAQVGKTMRDYRNITEVMFDDLVHGGKDANGHIILDWFKNGSFANGSRTPSMADVEQFYFRSLVSSTVNGVWTARDTANKIYVLRYETDNPSTSDGPEISRYYDKNERAVYHLYFYRETDHLTGYQDAPNHLTDLATNYSIAASEITKSAALGWQRGRYDFNRTQAFQLFIDTLRQGNGSDAWLDGAGWPGAWTIPVCDMGKNNWNTQYGVSKSNLPGFGMGYLPCCCGTDCRDTKRFIEAANMKCFQTLLHFCRNALGIAKFDTIDYGGRFHSSGTGC